MLYIAYQGIFDGTNYPDAGTPKQIGKAFNNGFSVLVHVWRIDNILYLGQGQPLTAVTEKYLQGGRFWIQCMNTEMETWIAGQSRKLYPNYFYLDVSVTPYPPYVTTSSEKLWTFGTVAINNSSIIVLPEIADRGLLSTIHLRCYGVCSTFLTFIKRMRNEGDWY